MKFKIRFIAIILFGLSALSLSSQAKAVKNPSILIKLTTSKIIEQLKLNKNQIKKNTLLVTSIIEELLMPHVASNTIARKVLGKYAKRITEEQQQQFSNAFRYYLIRFYSRSFAAYNDQTFEYYKSPPFEEAKRVTVKTKLIQSVGKPVSIDYRMQRSGDTWKIVDIKIEGISLVITNRSQFGTQISRLGIDKVVAKLEKKINKNTDN